MATNKQTLLHANAVPGKRFHTEALLQIHYFTHRQGFTHGPFYTQTLLHTEALKEKNSISKQKNYLQNLPRLEYFIGIFPFLI